MVGMVICPVVTTFEMAKSQSMQSVLGGQMWWRYVILDEGHKVKNEETAAERVARSGWPVPHRAFGSEARSWEPSPVRTRARTCVLE